MRKLLFAACGSGLFTSTISQMITLDVRAYVDSRNQLIVSQITLKHRANEKAFGIEDKPSSVELLTVTAGKGWCRWRGSNPHTLASTGF